KAYHDTARCSSATLRAIVTSASGTGGVEGGAGSGFVADNSNAEAGASGALGSGADSRSPVEASADTPWASSVPPGKAVAGHPATRMRSQSGTSSRSRSPAVATLAPSEAVRATRNQHHPAVLASPERSRRQATTNSRSTETG